MVKKRGFWGIDNNIPYKYRLLQKGICMLNVFLTCFAIGLERLNSANLYFLNDFQKVVGAHLDQWQHRSLSCFRPSASRFRDIAIQRGGFTNRGVRPLKNKIVWHLRCQGISISMKINKYPSGKGNWRVPYEHQVRGKKEPPGRIRLADFDLSQREDTADGKLCQIFIRYQPVEICTSKVASLPSGAHNEIALDFLSIWTTEARRGDLLDLLRE